MAWDTWGGARSAPRSGDPVIGESGDRKGKTPETHANLGWVGMTANKSFGILVRVDGGGVARGAPRSGDPVIGKSKLTT
jgi:hypothetical protein